MSGRSCVVFSSLDKRTADEMQADRREAHTEGRRRNDEGKGEPGKGIFHMQHVRHLWDGVDRRGKKVLSAILRENRMKNGRSATRASNCVAPQRAILLSHVAGSCVPALVVALVAAWGGSEYSS